MPHSSVQIARIIVISITALMLSACASMNPFSSYPQKAQVWKQQIAQGNSQLAVTKLADRKNSTNQLLYNLEAGRVAQIAGNPQVSLKEFRQAAEIYDQEEAAARLRLSSGARTGAAIITNDRALVYHSDPFERIFSETFQALNYLALDDAAGAAVEFRRVDHSQRQQELSHSREIAKQEKSNAKNDDRLEKYEGYFQGLNTAAALARSSIQNAYSYYLTAAFWEGIGSYNDALVDYKHALQIVPSAGFLLEDIERVSAKLDGKTNNNQGTVVIALEQGFVPPKQEISIPIPTIHGVLAVSFPIYSSALMVSPNPIRVRAGNDYVSTQPVVRIDAMAARALKEKIPAMLIRQIARTTAKYALQKEANDQSPLLGLASQLYNLMSEQADLRSWLSLPANAQIARLSLEPGKRQIVLSLPSGNTELMVPVSAAGVTLVRIIQTSSNQITTQVIPITQLSGELP